VETLLVNAGRKSDSRVLQKIGTNYARFDHDRRTESRIAIHPRNELGLMFNMADKESFALASQLSVLQTCLSVTSRLIRLNESTLLAAKLLVVARLLHKTLTKNANAPSNIESLGNRLASLRQRLLRHIDRRLVRTNIEVVVLVEDMTAFSLATSSNPTDVLKHFQHLRLEAIGRPMHGKLGVKQSVLQRLQLYLGMLRDSRTIFPGLLGPSLKALTGKPLLKDDAITAIEELSLDVHERWFADDVRNFVPWTRHEELQKITADHLYKVCAVDGARILADWIEDDISNESALRTVADIRRAALQSWLSSRRQVQGLDFREIMISLRAPFVTRSKDLIRKNFSDLHDSICHSILEVLEHWDVEAAAGYNVSLWDASIHSMEITDGALPLRRAILGRRNGTYELGHQVLKALETRSMYIEEAQAVIKDMKETRWDDDFDDYEEDSDYDSTHVMLSKTDSEYVQSTLRESAESTFIAMEQSLMSDIQNKSLDCTNSASPGIFILRTLRDLRLRLPRLLFSITPEVSQRVFCQDLVQKLQDSLTKPVTSKSAAVFASSISHFVASRSQIRSLWDGTPPLPVQPTPATFKFLRTIVKEMEALGPDLWSPDVVTRLKVDIKRLVSSSLDTTIRDLQKQASAPTHIKDDLNASVQPTASEQDEGHGKDQESPPEEPSRSRAEDTVPEPEDISTHANSESEQTHRTTDKLTQLLFDALYLRNALALGARLSTDGLDTRLQEDDYLESVVALLTKATAVDDAGIARLSKYATDYWRRTYLLFGLLASV